MKQLSWTSICGYCGQKNYGRVPQPSDEGLSTDCNNCGAYLITFEMIEYDSKDELDKNT